MCVVDCRPTITTTMEAVLEQVNAAKAYANGTLAAWTDPSAAVSDQTSRNRNLASFVAKQRLELAALEGAEARERLAADQQYKLRKQTITEGASGKLDALDILSVAKMVYDEVEMTMAKMADTVRQAGQQELHGYGYQSKMFLSLSISLDATRDAMQASVPFSKPLNALAGELQDASAVEAMAAIAPLRPYADEGIASKASIASAGVALASAVSAAHMAAVAADEAAESNTKGTSGAGDDEAGSSVLPAVRGWLSMLRVQAPAAVGGTGAEEREAKSSNASARSSESEAAGAAKAAALAGDLDGVLAQLPGLDKLAQRDRSVGAAAAKLRRGAEGRLLADLGLRFSDSMLTVQRFSFLEGVLRED